MKMGYKILSMKWVEIDGMEIGCHDVKWNKLDEVFVYEMKRQFSFHRGIMQKEGCRKFLKKFGHSHQNFDIASDVTPQLLLYEEI